MRRHPHFFRQGSGEPSARRQWRFPQLGSGRRACSGRNAYRGEDAREFLSGKGVKVDEMAGHIDGKFMSAFVRAVKPKKTCCCS